MKTNRRILPLVSDDSDLCSRAAIKTIEASNRRDYMVWLPISLTIRMFYMGWETDPITRYGRHRSKAGETRLIVARVG